MKISDLKKLFEDYKINNISENKTVENILVF